MEVLIVDDDRGLVEFVTVTLRRAGFSVSRAHDAPAVHRRMQEAEERDLILLDINLGAWNGFDFLKEIRSRSMVPVILLTGRASEEDKVAGLDNGADDYVTKPFASRELLARIRANIRRTRAEAEAAATPIAGGLGSTLSGRQRFKPARCRRRHKSRASRGTEAWRVRSSVASSFGRCASFSGAGRSTSK